MGWCRERNDFAGRNLGFLNLGNGLTVKLASGTANDGDSFTTKVVAQADTSGILTALGVNTLFQGNSAGNLEVRPDLIASPENFAAALTGQRGDSANLRRLATIRDQPLLATGTQTLGQFYAGMVGDIGVQVSTLNERENTQALLSQQIEAQRQSVSGVDPNEELTKLLQFQRAFQAASRFISTVDQTLQELFQIV